MAIKQLATHCMEHNIWMECQTSIHVGYSLQTLISISIFESSRFDHLCHPFISPVSSHHFDFLLRLICGENDYHVICSYYYFSKFCLKITSNGVWCERTFYLFTCLFNPPPCLIDYPSLDEWMDVCFLPTANWKAFTKLSTNCFKSIFNWCAT